LKKYRILIAPFVIFIVHLILVQYAKTHPQWTEYGYSRGLYPVIATSLQWLHRFLPFSLAEMILFFGMMMLLPWIYGLIKEFRRLSAENIAIEELLIKTGSKVLWSVFSLFLIFNLLWGLNYYRLPLSDLLQLPIEENEPEVLQQILVELIHETNTLRQEMIESVNGSMTLSGSLTYYLQKAPEWYQTGLFSQQFPILPLTSSAKPIIFSGLMSYTQIVGVYFPFTGEANINLNVPDYQILATMAHEIAHRHGFAREDEANFLAWLVCRQTYISPEAQYSGNMLALAYGLNALYQAAPDLYSDVYAELNAGVKRDFAHGRSFWEQYEGPVEQISTEVNDQYLQNNDQPDGVQSYGRMVDLLIAYYRSIQPKI
jgi:hypothetical protein